MTTLIIIVVGILGTVFLSFVAYKNWSDNATPKKAPLPTITSTAKKSSPQQRFIRMRWSWLWWTIGIGYLVIAYHYYPWHELEEMSENEIKEVKKSTCLLEIPDYVSDEMIKVDMRLGCPAIIKMKKNQMIVWWGDKKKFKSGWFYDEHAPRNGKVVDKFRVFQPRTGVESVEIKIHRYYDKDPLWYTRQ
ncbi:MAG: hypothetical protein Q7R89_00055 [bacterium]|nr:hypothetical protein [bacterium]